MKTKLLTIYLLSLTILVGCSSSSCDDSKPTSQWHDCSGTEVKKGKWTYIGEWEYGEWNGQGTRTFASGAKYVGELKNNKRHGHGTYTFANGDKYVGEWWWAFRHGQGTYTYADGTKEVGEWKYNEYVGK